MNRRTFKDWNCAATAAVIVVTLGAGAEAAIIVLDPAAYGQARDGVGLNPRDGVGEDTIPGVFGVLNVNPSLGQEERGIAEYNLSSIAGPVLSASFDSGLGGGTLGATTTYSAYGYAGDGRLTVADFDVTSSALLGTMPVVLAFSYNVTNFINDLLANNESFAGFTVLQAEHISGRKVWDFPSLTLTFASDPGGTVPEPTTAALALIGLGGLLLRRRAKG